MDSTDTNIELAKDPKTSIDELQAFTLNENVWVRKAFGNG